MKKERNGKAKNCNIRDTWKHHWGVWHTKTAVWQSDYLRVTPQGPGGPLLAVLPTDGALQLWWHSQPSPGTEEARRATTGLARANYPSETWRESLSCVSYTHIHWEQRLILFPLVSGDRDFLMNQERFLKHLKSSTLPPQLHLKVKSPFSLGQSMTKAYLDWPEWFLCSLCDCSHLNIFMRRHISSSHLYACDADVCLIWYLQENSSDQCSRW